MLVASLTATVMVALTVSLYLLLLGAADRAGHVIRLSRFFRMTTVLAVTFVAHTLAILLYALVFAFLAGPLIQGHLSGRPLGGFDDYFYYSASVYTTLGIGDIYPSGHLRILTAAEALNGLVLIAWSATFTYRTLEGLWMRSTQR